MTITIQHLKTWETALYIVHEFIHNKQLTQDNDFSPDRENESGEVVIRNFACYIASYCYKMLIF